jgi:hypothetical protein
MNKWIRAIRKAMDTNSYQSGVDASFYQLTSKIGFKLFRNDSYINSGVFSYLMENLLHSKGVSPQVFGWASVNNRFGMLVEKVDVVMRNYGAITREQREALSAWGRSWEDKPRFGNICAGADMHDANIGYKKAWDGSLIPMAIDVGFFYFQDQTPDAMMYSYENLNVTTHPFYEDCVRIQEQFDKVKGYDKCSEIFDCSIPDVDTAELQIKELSCV